MIAKRGTLWAIPLVLVLGGHGAARAQHVAGPIQTQGWGPSSGCTSCATGGSFTSGSFFGGGSIFDGIFGCRAGCHQPCWKIFCGPPHKHCAEGPPRIRFRFGCPKPICPPCDSQHWGYYQTCWSPWPWPPDWSHCPVQPPASQVVPPHTWASEYLDHIQRIQSGGTQPRPGAVRPQATPPGTTPIPGGQLPMPKRGP